MARSSTAAAKTSSKREAPSRTRSASTVRKKPDATGSGVPVDEVAGLLLLVVAGPFLLLSLLSPESLGLIGPPLQYAASELLGAAAFLLPVFLMLLGAELFYPVLRIPWTSYSLGLLILLLCLDVTAYLLAPPVARAVSVPSVGIWKYLLSLKGGFFGSALGSFLTGLVGLTGASILVGSAVVLDLSWLTGTSLRTFFLVLVYPVRLCVRSTVRFFARHATPLPVREQRRPKAAPPAEPPRDEEEEEEPFEIEDVPFDDDEAPAFPEDEAPREVHEAHGEPVVPDYPQVEELAEILPPVETPSAPGPLIEAAPEQHAAQAPLTTGEEPVIAPASPVFDVSAFEQLELFPLPKEEKPAKAIEKPRAHAGYKYKLPPLSILRDYDEAKAKEFTDYSDVIIDTLKSFGVEGKIMKVVRGPAVTRYELRPDKGVKVSKITNLANDLALVLKTPKVNLLVPIPGEQAIGVEIPNRSIEMVPFKRILETAEYRKGSRFALAIGKDISGRTIVEDLTRMPHLLIAGATGSGKTVCVNSIIASLLYKSTPHDMQVIMIDPKQVELSLYEGIPHLVRLEGVNQMGNTRIRWTPGNNIVTSAELATEVLKAVTAIMDQRFEVFKDNRARNILEYNSKAREPLARLVVVIDELADLMMVSSNAVEASICRLTQLGRAAGIHLIVATQRPSVDVITGLIKANMPYRIAFAVSSMVDSRTIIDKGGAEKLLGKGDMLLMPTGQEPQRVQGAYLETEEIERLVEFWAKQPAPQSQIILDFQSKQAIEEFQEDDEDELITSCVTIIKTTGQASASLFQRKLSIGYARAGRLIDLLEKRGIVGPADGAKPRKILIPVNTSDQES